MTDLENLEYMYVKLLSNRSQSRIFLRDFSGAIADTSKLLVFNPVNLKALFRRATALQCVGRYGEAIEIAEKILLQKLPESLLKSALKLRSDLKSQEQMDMQVQRAEGVPLSFVTDHQVIKLALGSPHIDKVAIGRRYSFKLCLGNEFGLFNKKLLPQDEGPALGIMASLIAIGDDQWHDLPGSSLQLALHKHGTAVFPNSGQVFLNLHGMKLM